MKVKGRSHVTPRNCSHIHATSTVLASALNSSSKGQQKTHWFPINTKTFCCLSNSNANTPLSASIINTTRLCWRLMHKCFRATIQWGCRQAKHNICFHKILMKVATRAMINIECLRGISTKRNHWNLTSQTINRLQKIHCIKRRGNLNTQRLVEKRCLAWPKWTMDVLSLRENCSPWKNPKITETV